MWTEIACKSWQGTRSNILSYSDIQEMPGSASGGGGVIALHYILPQKIFLNSIYTCGEAIKSMYYNLQSALEEEHFVNSNDFEKELVEESGILAHFAAGLYIWPMPSCSTMLFLT